MEANSADEVEAVLKADPVLILPYTLETLDASSIALGVRNFKLK
jgi:hypothetical protein